jgi:trk system potassium uptake protein TrkH
MIAQPEKVPQSFDLYRSYTQWIGGLSFVYLAMMLFYPERKLVHMRGMIGGDILRSKQLIITISVIFTIYTRRKYSSDASSYDRHDNFSSTFCIPLCNI